MCHQPVLSALSDASHLCSSTFMSQDFSRDLLDQLFSTVDIPSSSWMLSVYVKAWETLLVKTRAKNMLNNSVLCVSAVLWPQSAANLYFPCLFLPCSSGSSCGRVSRQPLWQSSFGIPNIILACLDSVSVFLLCSISPCFHLFCTFVGLLGRGGVLVLLFTIMNSLLAKPDSLFIDLFSSVLWWTITLSVGGCL